MRPSEHLIIGNEKFVGTPQRDGQDWMKGRRGSIQENPAIYITDGLVNLPESHQQQVEVLRGCPNMRLPGRAMLTCCSFYHPDLIQSPCRGRVYTAVLFELDTMPAESHSPHTLVATSYTQAAGSTPRMSPAVDVFPLNADYELRDGFEHHFRMLADQMETSAGFSLTAEFLETMHNLHCKPAITAGVFLLALLNCKNTTVDDVRPNRAQRKQIARAGGREIIHKVLRLKLPKPARTAAADSAETNSGGRRLHMCRGHFATYTPEKPMFGTQVGTYWVPAHARGDLAVGGITKDYQAVPQ